MISMCVSEWVSAQKEQINVKVGHKLNPFNQTWHSSLHLSTNYSAPEKNSATVIGALISAESSLSQQGTASHGEGERSYAQSICQSAEPTETLWAEDNRRQSCDVYPEPHSVSQSLQKHTHLSQILCCISVCVPCFSCHTQNQHSLLKFNKRWDINPTTQTATS